MGKRNSIFQFPFSFTHDVGKGNSNFLISFRFPGTLKTKLELLFSFFFSFAITQKNCNGHFRFSSSVFVWHLKTEFEFRFSFLAIVFDNYVSYLETVAYQQGSYPFSETNFQGSVSRSSR